MKFIKKLPTTLLGIMFVLFSVQFFIMLMTKAQMPPMSELATQFMGVLFASGFVWVIKIIELVCGILLLIPRTKKLGLILIAPIVAGILLTEALIIVPPVAQAIPVFIIFLLTVAGFYQNRAAFMPIIQK